MTNWIAEKVAELMNTNTAVVLDSFYANGTGGSYRLIFEPKGCEVWVDDGSEDGYYFESLYDVTSDTIAAVSEEIAKDWEAPRDRFCPDALKMFAK